MAEEPDKCECIKIEYEHRKEEINNLNNRNLQFLGFAVAVVGVLTTIGINKSSNIALLMANICILWTLIYILNNRQYIIINASYIKKFLEKDTEFKWETRLNSFLNINEVEKTNLKKGAKKKKFKLLYLNVPLFEMVFFLLFSLLQTFLILLPSSAKGEKEMSTMKQTFEWIIFIPSCIISLAVLYFVVLGLIKLNRIKLMEQCENRWEIVDEIVNSSSTKVIG